MSPSSHLLDSGCTRSPRTGLASSGNQARILLCRDKPEDMILRLANVLVETCCYGDRRSGQNCSSKCAADQIEDWNAPTYLSQCQDQGGRSWWPQLLQIQPASGVQSNLSGLLSMPRASCLRRCQCILQASSPVSIPLSPTASSEALPVAPPAAPGTSLGMLMTLSWALLPSHSGALAIPLQLLAVTYRNAIGTLSTGILSFIYDNDAYAFTRVLIMSWQVLFLGSSVTSLTRSDIPVFPQLELRSFKPGRRALHDFDI